MTPPPDTQPAAETLEEIAHKIVKRYLDDYINDHQLEQQVVSALRNERERAAKVAEAMRPTGGRMWTDEQSACFEALTECANAIRKGGK